MSQSAIVIGQPVFTDDETEINSAETKTFRFAYLYEYDPQEVQFPEISSCESVIKGSSQDPSTLRVFALHESGCKELWPLRCAPHCMVGHLSQIYSVFSSRSSDPYHSARSTSGESASQDLTTVLDSQHNSRPPVHELQMQLVEKASYFQTECYGAESKEYWTPVQNLVDEDLAEDDGFRLDEFPLVDPSEIVIGEKIAEGGQAHVHFAQWRSHDPSNNSSNVVVKIFKCRPDLLKSWKLRRQLQQVMALGRLSSAQHQGAQHICKVLGVCKAASETWIIMEAMSGDLRSYLNLARRLAPQASSMDRMLMIMYCIAMGMETLHASELIHRDLKASNILISTNLFEGAFHNGDIPREHYALIVYQSICKVKIGDYETSEDVIGTAFWRAPEVLQALKEDSNADLKLTQKADVYSFAMVCYELLTGLIPFDGHDRCDYDLILSGNRPALPRDLPEGVSKLVERCWEGNPQQRPEFTVIVEVLSSHLKGDPNHFSSGSHYNFFAESRS